MSRFVFHAEADRELDDAMSWYEERKQGLGGQFRAAVDQALSTIQSNPKAFARVVGPYRRLVMRRFPYGIIYWPREGEVYILSVFHSHRDPERWRERL
ncbi:MAG TPA: type II toxin-antitoxin system RelE/ParE family toxin [Rhizomicrobium sp.]|jgi:plasmid stabilization system protein ParE